MKVYGKLVALLSSEFHRYLMSNPEFAQNLPSDALVVFRVEGVGGFNRWSEGMALRNRKKGQPLVCVTITGWSELPSWEDVKVEKVIAEV